VEKESKWGSLAAAIMRGSKTTTKTEERGGGGGTGGGGGKENEKRPQKSKDKGAMKAWVIGDSNVHRPQEKRTPQNIRVAQKTEESRGYKNQLPTAHQQAAQTVDLLARAGDNYGV